MKRTAFLHPSTYYPLLLLFGFSWIVLPLEGLGQDRRLNRSSFLENQDFIFDGYRIKPQNFSTSIFYENHRCPTNRDRPTDPSNQEYWIHDHSCNTGNGVVEGDGYNSWAYINSVTRNTEGHPMWVSEGRADSSKSTNWLETWKLGKDGAPVSFTSCQSDAPSTRYQLWKLWDYQCYTVDSAICKLLQSRRANDQSVEIQASPSDSESALALLKHLQHMKFNTKVRFDLVSFSDVLMSESTPIYTDSLILTKTLLPMCHLFQQFSGDAK